MNDIIVILLYAITQMKKRKPTPVYLEDIDKAKLTEIASLWGVSLSSAVQRMVREYSMPSNAPVKVSEAVINIALSSFKSLRFDDFDMLPRTKGVYVVTNHGGDILYVGKANGNNGFYGRWRGRWSHHKDEEFCANGAAWIYYLELEESCVAATEAELIRELVPSLNKREEMPIRTQKRESPLTDLSYARKLTSGKHSREFEYPRE